MGWDPDPFFFLRVESGSGQPDLGFATLELALGRKNSITASKPNGHLFVTLLQAGNLWGLLWHFSNLALVLNLSKFLIAVYELNQS